MSVRVCAGNDTSRSRLAFPLRHRSLVALALVAIAGLFRFGLRATAVACVVFAVLALAWRIARHRRVSPILLGYLRGKLVYGRTWAWTVGRLGLASADGLTMTRLGKVRSTRLADRLRLRLAPGQTPETIAALCEPLRHLWGAERVSSAEIGPGRVLLTVYRSDPLARPLVPAPLSGSLDLSAIPLGQTEAGEPFTLRLAGSHLLVAGSSGSGKSSLLWGLIRALSPSVGSRTVALWVVDPKGGVELSAGMPLFARYADAELSSMADLLDDALDELRARTAKLRGLTRSHVPTTEMPLLVLVVDELAALISYCPDTALRKRMVSALHLLLTQGRAAGITVVAAVQDPRKESVPFRDLFTVRVALRLVEPESVDLVLGDGARNRGAACDQIPVSLPGVGYVRADDRSGIARVRIAYVSDADIAALVRTVR
jgi:DNA segregation ATPase FtsK/SpoIIIE, S-DNA-T family